MITLPEVTVVGTLTRDPELRFTPAGHAVANFTIATNDRKRNADGSWEDGDATFLNGSIWRDYAENLANSLKKGDRVMAVGRLRQRSYEKDGVNRTVLELDAEEVGPALKWATASVTKAARNGSSNGNGGAPKASGWRSSGGQQERRSPVPVPGDDSEPPF